MRRMFLTLGTAIILTGPVSTAHAQVIQLTAALFGANETPAPGVLTGAFGTATVTADLGTQVVSWTVTVFNMPSGTTAGHFHVGGPGLAGPTVVNFTIPTDISNDYSFSGSSNALSTAQPNQGIRSWEDFLQALVGGATYINIHSRVNPGGEIRGQVFRVQ